MKKGFSVLFIFLTLSSFAQRGKDGAITIATAGTVVNSYTTLTSDAAAGNTSIVIASSAGLSPGDLLMIIQMQGAKVNCHQDTIGWNPNNSQPSDTTYGHIENYYTCGNNEFAEISSVPNGTTVTLSCGLKNAYTAFGKVQVVKVPRYLSLTINAPGTIVCPAWDGSIGGVIAIEVVGNTIINAGSSINASAMGFRGAKVHVGRPTAFGGGAWGHQSNNEGGNKGEGIAGDTSFYKFWFHGTNGKGAIANAGGGGTANNGGGGGGANAGTINWTGRGNPDVSVAGYITAWNLETASFATATSSGGGRGGYTYSNSTNNPTTTAPGNAAWSGDQRRVQGGLGGRPLNYSTGRLFLGGGGGAGDSDDPTTGASLAGPGANGGGIIYLMCYGSVSGAGQIISNGGDGGNTNTTGSAPLNDCLGRDGAGGAGGGGAIVINASGPISGLTITANGGNGGNQQLKSGFSVFNPAKQAYGPGGGGGGGYIGISNNGGGLTQTINGGNNGIVQYLSGAENCQIDNLFPANGATKGGTGLAVATITNFSIDTNNVSICSGNSANLTVSLTGTVPSPTPTINWYTSATGGSPIASGTSYTTPVLSSTTTYYVGTCPGWYRIPVTVTVASGLSAPSVSAASTTVCAGSTISLSTTVTGVTYSWTGPNGFTSSVQNPTLTGVTTAASGTYSLTVSSGACSSPVSTIAITVNNLPSAPSVSVANNSICSGSTISLSTTATGVTYNWTGPNGFSSSLQNPTITGATTAASGTYSLTVSAGTCTSSLSTVSVTVNSTPSAPSVSAVNTTICSGNTISLSTTAIGVTYSWTGPNGFTSSIQNPTISGATTAASGTYSLSVANGSCTSTVSTISITVNATPAIPSVSAVSTSICAGDNISLSTTVTGVTYNWSGPNGFSSSSQNPTITGAGLAASGTYTLTVSSAGCTSQPATIAITVNSSASVPSISAASTTLCSGDTLFLSTTVTGVTYNWTGPNGFSSSLQNPQINNVSVAAAGTYSLNVSLGTCTSSNASIAIAVNTVPANPQPIAVDSSICNGDAIQLGTSVTGVTYNWTGPNGFTDNTQNPIITNPGLAGSGTYSLIVISNGCASGAGSVSVTVNNLPSAPVGQDVSYCQNAASTVLTANGSGGSFNWYTVPSGGTSLGSVPVPPTNNVDTLYYYVSETLGNCEGPRDTVVVVINSFFGIPLANDTTYCVGDIALPVNAFGTSSLNWYLTPTGGSALSGAPIPSTSVPGLFTYYVSQGNGTCESVRDTLVVTINALPILPLGTDTTYCQNAIASPLTASAGGALNWYNTSSGGTPLGAAPIPSTTTVGSTNYFVSQTLNGCESLRDTVSIQVINLQSMPVTQNVNYCEGDLAIALTASGTSNLNWWGTSSSGGTPSSIAPIPSTSSAGSTTYYVSQGTGACESPRSPLTVVVSATPVVSFTVSGSSICEGACVNFTESSSVNCATLIWNFGDGTIDSLSTPSHCYLNQGSYNVSAVCVSSNGCRDTALISSAVTVNPKANAVFSINPNQFAAPGEVVSVIADTNQADVFSWLFDDPSSASNSDTNAVSSHSYAANGNYCIQLIASYSGGSCPDTSVVCIEVLSGSSIEVPNVFTPNNDGKNDVFKINTEGIETLNCVIYDRWGLKITELSGLTSSWDGQNANGKKVADGVFYYLLDAKDFKGETKQLSGFIQLISN